MKIYRVERKQGIKGPYDDASQWINVEHSSRTGRPGPFRDGINIEKMIIADLKP